jgi:hypothetical protein
MVLSDAERQRRYIARLSRQTPGYVVIWRRRNGCSPRPGSNGRRSQGDAVAREARSIQCCRAWSNRLPILHREMPGIPVPA